MRRRVPWKYGPLVALWAAVLSLAFYKRAWGEIVAVFVGLALGFLIVRYQRRRRRRL